MTRIVRVVFAEPAFLPGTRQPVSQVAPGQHDVVITEDAIGLLIKAPSGHAERVPWPNVRSISYSPETADRPGLAEGDARPKAQAPKAVA